MNVVSPLAQRETDPQSILQTINPSAGFHPIPTDPRELAAAIRAGERSLRRFPYYEARYGERGRQFASSDSAWLVTLATYPQATVNRDVLWLANLLAARGMPRWLMESHLRFLVEELTLAVPENHTVYERLRVACEWLGDLRRVHLDDETLAHLAAEFRALVEPGELAGLSEMGEILVAAVTDERAGVNNAVTSLEAWLLDPARFSAQWCQAVRTTIALARSHR